MKQIYISSAYKIRLKKEKNENQVNEAKSYKKRKEKKKMNKTETKIMNYLNRVTYNICEIIIKILVKLSLTDRLRYIR